MNDIDVEESILRGVEEIGTELEKLFTREAREIGITSDPILLGRQQAYLACAEACVKATTRKLIVFPEVAIKFRVPSDAKP